MALKLKRPCDGCVFISPLAIKSPSSERYAIFVKEKNILADFLSEDTNKFEDSKTQCVAFLALKGFV